MKQSATVRIRLVIAIALLAALELANAQNFAAIPEPERQSERRVVINVHAMTLELYEDNERVKSYRIAVGKPSTPTPLGSFQIATKVKHPTWYGPRKQVVLPGKNNPVGTRWMGLDKKGYGIHGTNEPNSIGHAASHGCIRMLNREAEDLFTRVQVGDAVEIQAETETADATTMRDFYRLDGARAADLRGGG